MATFTKIPDSEIPVVSVNPLNKIAKINDNVYGGFTEYVVVLIPYHGKQVTDILKDIWAAASTAVSTILATPYRTRTVSAKM
jgi:aspartokinase-like uncharacterized kinase